MRSPFLRKDTVTFVIASLLALAANADSGWLELELYECSNYGTALFCEKECVKLEPTQRLRIQVDSNASKVLLQFVGERIDKPSNVFLTQCKVFDVKNWDCSTSPASDAVSLATGLFQTTLMTNGIYTSVADASQIESIKPQCAK
jgi:hypothetical protein